MPHLALEFGSLANNLNFIDSIDYLASKDTNYWTNSFIFAIYLS